MRDFDSTDEARFLSTSRRMYHKVQIEDASGAWVDYTTDGGSAIDWVDSWRISATVEEPVAALSVELFRAVDGESLVPTRNVGSEKIKPGRGIRVYVAATIIGDPTPSDGEYWLLFDGAIDGWSTGEREDTISLECRDLLGLLADTWTIAQNTYGSAAGTPVENVTAAIIAERISTLSTNYVGDPDFGIFSYEQKRESILSAILANIDLFGWLVRYRWSDVYGGFRVEVFEPDRAISTPMWTVTPADYFEIPFFAEDSDDLRNEGICDWSGGTVTATDDASIAEYGRVRTIVLDASQDDQINSAARATAFITPIVADLSQPLAQARASLPLVPWVQINDYYRFTPNPVLFEEDQDMAVVAFELFYGPDGAGSEFTLRGQPTGGVTRWDSVRDRLEVVVGVIPDAEDPSLEADDIEFYYTLASGSAGFASEGDAAGSLGGWVSTTPVATTINGLFRAVGETERVAGITLYRSIAVVNTQTSAIYYDWEAVLAYLAENESDDIAWAIGFDPQGVHEVEELFSAISADEETAPAGVTFSSPTGVDSSPTVGGETIPGGSGRIIHIRLTVTAGAAAKTTDDSLVFVDQVPQSSVLSS